MEMHVEAQWNKYAPSKQHNYSTKQNSRIFTIQIKIKIFEKPWNSFRQPQAKVPLTRETLLQHTKKWEEEYRDTWNRYGTPTKQPITKRNIQEVETVIGRYVSTARCSSSQANATVLFLDSTKSPLLPYHAYEKESHQHGSCTRQQLSGMHAIFFPSFVVFSKGV